MRGVADISYYRTDGGWLFVSQGGVRFGPQTRRVRPFGQALFGFAFHRVGGFGGAFWTAQFGGGIDISMRAAGPALRLGLDMPVFFSDGGQKIIRGTIGIVFNPVGAAVHLADDAVLLIFTGREPWFRP